MQMLKKAQNSRINVSCPHFNPKKHDSSFENPRQSDYRHFYDRSFFPSRLFARVHNLQVQKLDRAEKE